MSIQLIQQYYSKVEQMIRYSGTRNESTLRKPFQGLLRVRRAYWVKTMKIVCEMLE